MNQETNAGTQEMQQEKTAPSKRSRSSSKNRPVLVTASSNDQVTEEQPIKETSEPVKPVEDAIPATTAEDTQTRRFPKFFSNVGKNDKSEAQEAEQTSARMARATRNTGTASAKSSATKETKPAPSTNANKAVSKPAPARPQQKQGGFKTKYLYGMIIYVVVAMFVGQYERTFLVSNHMDKVLFQIGSYAVTTSTALYLLTLILLLIILARFDLIPRSLGAMSGQPASQSGKSGQSASQSETTKGQQPTMKQGVKGADDDLYQEYREQQRYLQKRERKK
jgi:hypothetical protein